MVWSKKTVKPEGGNGAKAGGFESGGLVQVKPRGGLIRQGSMGEPFVPLVQREVKLQHSQSMCGIRSDEGGKLSFLRTRTLGERLREGRPWATARRSISIEKEVSTTKTLSALSNILFLDVPNLAPR